ncbi:hypothetical protein FRB90_003268 [Tulasnella sp. 427]|nr:hypothetical protein FRB90_003268 [Tulasnella sp. 427]
MSTEDMEIDGAGADEHGETSRVAHGDEDAEPTDLRMDEADRICDEISEDMALETDVAEPPSVLINVDAQATIARATLGFVLWDVRDPLKHGYVTERVVNDAAVKKLRVEVERSDQRYTNWMVGSVSATDLIARGIKPSLNAGHARSLTRTQINDLDIVGIAGQHRQRAGELILKDQLRKLERSGRAPSLLGQDQTPEEDPRGAASDLDAEPHSRANVPRSPSVPAQDREWIDHLTYWPLMLVDRDILPRDSKDKKVVRALHHLASNLTLHQNSGEPYEQWLPVLATLRKTEMPLRERLSLAREALSGASTDLLRYPPMLRLVTTLLSIPALRSTLRPPSLKRVLDDPGCTVIVLTLQATLNCLTEVFTNVEDIDVDIITTLDSIYVQCLQSGWVKASCNLQDFSDGPLGTYSVSVLQALRGLALDADRRQRKGEEATSRLTKSLESSANVMERRKVPFFSPALMEDTIRYLGKVSAAFSWAERYFSPETPWYGSFTPAKFTGSNRKYDAVHSVIHEIMYLDSQWRAEMADCDQILSELIPLVFKYAREASAAVEATVSKQELHKLPIVDNRVISTFYTAFGKKQGSKSFKGQSNSGDKNTKHPWGEDEIQNHIAAVPTIIKGLEVFQAGISRCQKVLDTKKNRASVVALPTFLLYVLCDAKQEIEALAQCQAVVGFFKGLMNIGVGRTSTPCMIESCLTKRKERDLRLFSFSDINSADWERIERPLKNAGKNITTLMALLPADQVNDVYVQWKTLLETTRALATQAVLGNASTAAVNPKGQDDYINRSKVPALPPAPVISQKDLIPANKNGSKRKKQGRFSDDDEDSSSEGEAHKRGKMEK